MAQQQQIDLTGAGFRDDEAIRVGGTLYSIGVRVRRYDHPHGLNAYLTNEATVEEEDRRTGAVTTRTIRGRRYSTRKGGLGAVRQVVVHHAGGDRADPAIMYDVLHNQRRLSCQFAVEDGGGMVPILDPQTGAELHPADPTMIWQMLDAKEQAWHAGKANPRSIGIECALYPDAERNPDFYGPRGCRRRRNLPHPVLEEVVHGRLRRVFGFTDPQLVALSKLCAGIWVALRHRCPASDLPPAPVFPRDKEDSIPRAVAAGALDHVGLVGHLQLTARKTDPAGFPWEGFEAHVAQECAMMAAVLMPG